MSTPEKGRTIKPLLVCKEAIKAFVSLVCKEAIKTSASL